MTCCVAVSDDVGRLLAEQLGQPEVGDLHPAPLVDEDVLRLDVAMDDPLVVGELQGIANLRHDGQGLLGRHRRPHWIA